MWDGALQATVDREGGAERPWQDIAETMGSGRPSSLLLSAAYLYSSAAMQTCQRAGICSPKHCAVHDIAIITLLLTELITELDLPACTPKCGAKARTQPRQKDMRGPCSARGKKQKDK